MVVSKNGKYTLQTQPVGVTNISQGALASVSQYRREILENEMNKSNTTSHFLKGSSGLGNVTSTSRTRIEKTANFSSGGGSTSYRGPGDTGRQVPEVYSPLWLNSNLNMPRERATINAWCRTFFALNPIVQNAISLHSTYPISKLNIKCKNPKVNAFFENMIDELDLMNICVQIAQEYWTLGEAFPYAELDESTAKWSRIIIQNPDYMVVKRSVIAGEPLISLRPDENLRKICTGNSASDIQQRMQLNPSVYEHVRRGENIPLSNFYVSHIARKIAPYENRGTGLPVCCFKQLMLFDKLRECHSEDTEFLTKDGWKTINDVMEISKEINPNPEYVNGIQLDDNGEIEGIYKLKDGIEVACFNPETECLEYHVPKELHMSQYEGKMHHFIGKKVDILVSPNHKMYVKEKHWKNGFSQPYKLVKANDLNDNKSYKFLSKVKWNGKKIDNAIVCGKNVPIKLYMKVLGYIASEGWVYINERNDRYDRSIGLSQLTSSDCYQDMVDSFSEFANIFDKKVSSYTKICGSGFSENSKKHIWSGRIHGKDIAKFFINEIGNGIKAGSFEKRLPRWIFDLDSETLQILLDALVKGDGTEGISKYGTNSKNFRYSTVSKELADNVYELAYKCGFVPNICITDSDKRVKEYIVMWSDTVYGNEPNFAAWDRPPSGNGGGAIMKKVDYNGKVWCFETPTGLFITRRNGKITIQGNSKFAQADNMVNPLTLIKVGGGADNYKPTPEDLQMWRNVFEECHDEETEVLTDRGFIKFDEAIEISNLFESASDKVSKIISSPKKGVKIACFNSDTEKLEYHEPSESHVYDYNGEMYHFSNTKMDIKVTPNHNMWVQRKVFNSFEGKKEYKWSKWEKIPAKDMKFFDRRFRSKIAWDGDDEIKNVNVAGRDVPVELYLEYLGYVISEGCIYTDNKSQHTVGICQTITRKYGKDNSEKQQKMKNCVDLFSKFIQKSYSDRVVERQDCEKEVVWNGIFCGKDLFNHFVNEVHTNGNYKSKDKKIPRWALNLSPRLLKILLKALVLGDGGTQSNNGIFYYTSSKHLADDVYEAAYKAGYVPTVFERNNKYTIQWSSTNIGEFPLVNKYSTDPRTKDKKEIVTKVNYQGKVWCFTVPTGLFITRRNGKITIQGNSQYDKDFKIFTHDGVSIEKIGSTNGIYDISGDITQILKEIYVGLMAPSVIMDGGSDTTYTNGGVALDVLRQRYMTFRNMLSSWLRRKIFAPISKLNDFYDLVDGEKVLIVPEVEWNHMSLFDMSDYINNLSGLLSGETKKVSLQSMYKSLGLEYEDEMRKIRKESIDEMIQLKEKESLARMSLNDLRSISDSDTIEEVTESPLPGENPYGDPTQGGGGGGLGLPGGPGGGFDLGGPPGGGMGDLGGLPGGGDGMPSL